MTGNHPRVSLLFRCESNFDREIVRGVLNYQREHGPWQLFNCPAGATPVAAPLDKWDGEGAILSIYGPDAFGLDLKCLDKLRMPVVNVASRVPDLPIPQVLVDNRAVGRIGAEHLIECGLTNFAFMGAADSASSRLRSEGFHRRLDEAELTRGVFDPPMPMKDIVQWNRNVGAASQWLQQTPKPLGVMCYTDRMARWMAQLCMLLEIAIPDDVALLGVDDDPLLCELSQPPLSSVRLPLEKIGYESARLLDRLMDGEPAPAAPLLMAPQGVAARQSTDLLAMEDADVADALRFIRESADQPLSVPDVLQAVPVSRRSLERRFRAVLGRTIREEILRQHLIRAKEHLANGSMPVAEVARQSGFQSLEHFHRTFRRVVGQTPARYRRAFQMR